MNCSQIDSRPGGNAGPISSVGPADTILLAVKEWQIEQGEIEFAPAESDALQAA
jgi:hypothetical protein